MLFGDLADDIYPYAGVIGGALALIVGLYHQWRGKDGESEPQPPESEVEKRTCPHCAARFTDAGDAYCPECRKPLDD